MTYEVRLSPDEGPVRWLMIGASEADLAGLAKRLGPGEIVRCLAGGRVIAPRTWAQRQTAERVRALRAAREQLRVLHPGHWRKVFAEELEDRTPPDPKLTARIDRGMTRYKASSSPAELAERNRRARARTRAQARMARLFPDEHRVLYEAEKGRGPKASREAS